VSLLLRHGADTRLSNSRQQRPVDVAVNDDVIDLLSQHVAGDEHLPHDVMPAVIDSTGCAKRRHLQATDECVNHDVPMKKTNYDNVDDDDVLCTPLDLSVDRGDC